MPNEHSIVGPPPLGHMGAQVLDEGEALIRLASGERRRAELHWYEAHGVGRRNMKFKRYLD